MTAHTGSASTLERVRTNLVGLKMARALEMLDATVKGLEQGGPYQVVIEKSYREDQKREAGFRGEATVRVVLPRLQKFVAKEKARERARRDRGRKVLSGQEYEGGRK